MTDQESICINCGKKISDAVTVWNDCAEPLCGTICLYEDKYITYVNDTLEHGNYLGLYSFKEWIEFETDDLPENEATKTINECLRRV